MGLTVLTWLVIGVSILLVLLAAIALWFQVLRRREGGAALQGCQSQVKEMRARIYQQEDEIRELTAGLRAEKAHVEQLQRQVKFSHGVRVQLQSDL